MNSPTPMKTKPAIVAIATLNLLAPPILGALALPYAPTFFVVLLVLLSSASSLVVAAGLLALWRGAYIACLLRCLLLVASGIACHHIALAVLAFMLAAYLLTARVRRMFWQAGPLPGSAASGNGFERFMEEYREQNRKSLRCCARPTPVVRSPEGRLRDADTKEIFTEGSTGPAEAGPSTRMESA